MNNAALLPQLCSALAIAFLSASTLTPPSRAEAGSTNTTNATFFCGTSNGVPATMARTPRGEMPMILWNSPTIVPSGDTQKQCEDVSNRLQSYYNNGTFKYITTRRMNGQTVACVAEQNNDEATCSGDPLFALNIPPQTKPADALQGIFRIRMASASPIMETSKPVYISLDEWLQGKYPPTGSNTRRSQSRNNPQ
ncbi:COP23 domain-containing protein [Aerosakkonema sp. BLCC-F183]|uniref:COP23 domain-containing protein n=1 Tax=Aerosakkonema sp. BLCC-F183 TaxID=3342834 RepID=UPI0035B87837